MYKENIPRNKKINFEKVKKYGFKLIDDSYSSSFDILNNKFTLFMYISLSGDINTLLVDNSINEEYFLHKNLSAQGHFNQKLTFEYNNKLNEIFGNILDNISYESYANNKIIEYMKNKYNIDKEYPFEDDNETFIFRRKDNNKWISITMYIPYKKLKIDRDGSLFVMNVKHDDELIPSLIDNIHYFECYHMNKKKWISIALDEVAKIDEIYKLIDRSYELVGKKNR